MTQSPDTSSKGNWLDELLKEHGCTVIPLHIGNEHRVAEFKVASQAHIATVELEAQLKLAKMYSAMGRDDFTWGKYSEHPDGLPPEVLDIFPEFRSSTADIPRGKKEFMDFVVEQLEDQKGKQTR